VVKNLRPFCGWLARGVGTLVVWTIWLGLTFLLLLQVYVATVNELEVPRFVLHAFEQRLAAAGMHAAVGRTRFDPSGRVLMENVSVTLPAFAEPLVTAQAVYARLDPWALAFGRFEPLELQITGASLRVPAMFSPSGRADEIIRDLDASVDPRGQDLRIANLNFRLGQMRVSVHGTLHVSGLQTAHAARLPFTTLLVRSYGPLTRQFAGLVAQLGALDQPILQAELTPSESHGAIVNATLSAAALRLPPPIGVEASDIRLSSRFPLPINEPEEIAIQAAAGSVRVARLGGTAEGLRAQLRCELAAGQVLPVWQGVEIAADAVAAEGFEVRTPLVSLTRGPWPKLRAAVRGRLLDAPLAAEADLDFRAKTAAVKFDGGLASALLDPVGARLKRDLRKTIEMPFPIRVAGDAQFGAGWKFQRVSGRVSALGLRIRGVRIDEARANIEFDGQRLAASHALVRFGQSVARGSYEMPHVSDRGFRFLLEGRLEPLNISPWFTGKWWSEFFSHFRFPGGPPAANVDWRGRWPNDHETSIFLFVDSPAPVYNGAAFDHATARLFLRPNVLTDGLEIEATRGAGRGAGTFRSLLGAHTVDFDLTSSLDFGLAAQALAEKGGALVAPYAFDRPPALVLRGHLDQPGALPEGAAPPGGHTPPWRIQALHIEAKSDGGFRFHEFPLDSVALTAEVHDDDIVLSPLVIGFAGGFANSRVAVSGDGAAKQIRFNADLKGASLGRVIDIVGKYSPSKKNPPAPAKPSATEAFLKSRADVRLDLSVAAVGAFADPFSYHGGGTAQLQGPGLYDVPLLGGLSRLLSFTMLRFTSAKASFQVDGPTLAFSELQMTGANSAIKARGSYALDRHALDFNAKIYPLGESKGFVQRFIDVPLSFLSDVFEVKLRGSLDKPSWALLAGPSSLARTLASPGNNAAKSPSSAPPTPLAHPVPAPSPDSSSFEP
jgi:hypothetical protein